jgi:hypothetical protein
MPDLPARSPVADRLVGDHERADDADECERGNRRNGTGDGSQWDQDGGSDRSPWHMRSPERDETELTAQAKQPT